MSENEKRMCKNCGKEIELKDGVWYHITGYKSCNTDVAQPYANKDEKDLSLLKKKAAELEYELSKVKVEIHNKEQAIQHQEEVQRSIIMQRKYMASVLRRIIKTSFSSRKVTTKPEWIEKLYGMSFDIPSLDTLLADTSKSIEQLYEISEMDLIEIVSARKISKGQKEPEIMQEILANEESDKK